MLGDDSSHKRRKLERSTDVNGLSDAELWPSKALTLQTMDAGPIAEDEEGI